MGGFGFGQGYCGQYAVGAVALVPPTLIASTELAASFAPVSDLVASYTATTELAATHDPVTALEASKEGS